MKADNLKNYSNTYIRMNKEDKDKNDTVIRGVYYDVDTGFGSINDTYQQAKKILNIITYNDEKRVFGTPQVTTNKTTQRV